jgi:peptide-methionine (S)-S-oxide reductase
MKVEDAMKCHPSGHLGLALFFTMTIVVSGACDSVVAESSVALPDPLTDEPVAMSKGQPTAVFAGGCFWGVEAVFDHLKGVKTATAGYSGGSATTATYEIVSDGRTGHAESVKVTYDRSQITYGQLLKVFFSVAHDPTERNRQGPDEGTQYRSVIFTASADQKRIAEAYIAQLNQEKVFKRPIGTEITDLAGFYEAEAYHQNYVANNPRSAYVRAYDLPKLDHLRKQFPDWYKP